MREDLDERPFHIEGLNAAQWVVVDYGDIVVHIFEKELRDYYQLEDFWADAQITEIAGEPECSLIPVIIRQTEQIENSKEYKYCEHTKWQTTTKTRKTEDSIFLQWGGKISKPGNSTDIGCISYWQSLLSDFNFSI